MEAIRFYWRALNLAFKHSLDRTQTLLFIGFVCAGLAGYLVPRFAQWEIFVSGWQAALLTLTLMVLLRLLLAPYWLFREKADELSRLELSQKHNTEQLELQQRTVELRAAHVNELKLAREQRERDHDPAFQAAIQARREALRQKTPRELVAEWLLPTQSMARFGDKKLWEHHSTVTKEHEDHQRVLRGIGREIEATLSLRKDFNSTVKAGKKVEALRKDQIVARIECASSRADIQSAQSRLAKNLTEQLERGSLVAKGFRYPTGNDEEEIPSSQWRDLNIDFRECSAKRRHDGAVLYTSIMIGQPDPAV